MNSPKFDSETKQKAEDRLNQIIMQENIKELIRLHVDKFMQSAKNRLLKGEEL